MAQSATHPMELSLRVCQNLRHLQPEWWEKTCCPEFQNTSSSSAWPRRHPLEDELVWPAYMERVAFEVESFELEKLVQMHMAAGI